MQLQLQLQNTIRLFNYNKKIKTTYKLKLNPSGIVSKLEIVNTIKES
jgi:hypothetical protein